MKKYKLSLILSLLMCLVAPNICFAAGKYRPQIGRLDYYVDEADSITLDLDNFDDILSSADTNVQLALDTLDDGAVNVAGDTMTGDLQISKSLPQYSLFDTTTSSVVSRWNHNPAGGITTLYALVYKPGGLGNALDFDGVDDFINMGNDSSLDLTNISISLWIKTPETGNVVILEKGLFNYLIHMSATPGKLNVGIGGAGDRITSATSVNDDTWHHVVMTFNNTTKELRLHVDGAEDGNSPITTINNATSVVGDLTFGARDGGAFPCEVEIDEVNIWSRIISDNNISTLWNSGNGFYVDVAGSMGTSLVGAWHHDELAMNTAPGGTDTEDSSANTNHGTASATMTDGDFISGKVLILGADEEIVGFWSQDGSGALEAGINGIGDPDARLVLEGKTHEINIAGNKIAYWDANGTLTIDNGGDYNAITLISSVGQTDYLLALQDSSLVDTHLFGDAGCKLAWNAGGDAEYFGGVDVGNDEHGKKHIVRRMAAEGDDYIELYTNSSRTCQLQASNNFTIACSSGKIMSFGKDIDNNFRFGDSLSVNINPYIRHYGYITADTTQKYVEWKVDDTSDYFILSREDAFVLGLDVQMPLKLSTLTEGSVPYVGASGVISEDNGTLFWDSTNETLALGETGSEITIPINGTTYKSHLRVSDFGDTHLAQSLLHRHSNTANVGSALIAARARGVGAAHTIVQNGDNLLDISSSGWNGNDYSLSSAINFEVDGTPSDNDMPGRIVFFTSPDGSETLTESFRVKQDQTVLFKNDVVYSTSGSGLPYGEIYANDAGEDVVINTAGVANKKQVTAFDTDGVSNNMTPDHTNDHITITNAGIYFCSISLHVDSQAGSAATFGFALYKNNGATQFANVHGHRDLPAGAGGNSGSLSMSGLIDLAVNDTIELWAWNEDNTQDVTVDDVTLSLMMQGGT